MRELENKTQDPFGWRSGNVGGQKMRNGYKSRRIKEILIPSFVFGWGWKNGRMKKKVLFIYLFIYIILHICPC